MPLKRTLCHELSLAGFAIQLWQEGRDNFKVIYGKQVKANLTYERAATEYGACIMHALACEDIIDNRLPGER
jgi:hypothetical protein